jgi:hypothetical protein
VNLMRSCFCEFARNCPSKMSTPNRTPAQCI